MASRLCIVQATCASNYTVVANIFRGAKCSKITAHHSLVQMTSTRSLSLGTFTPAASKKSPEAIEKRKNAFEALKTALLCYKNLNGDYHIPANFVVPNDIENWPEETQGMNIGSTLSLINGGFAYRDKINELNSIGLNIDLAEFVNNSKVVDAALLHYKQMHGNLDIPKKFTVPSGDTAWPEITWGYKIGRIALNIRAGKTYLHRREHLRELGFKFKDEDLTV